MPDRRRFLLSLAAGVAAAGLPSAGTSPARAAAGRSVRFLVVDAASGAEIVRDGRCEDRAPPFSTFKVPIALMGYDAGILVSATEPVWEWRPGYGGPARDHGAFDPAGWQRQSVLWYSREIVRRIGADRFARAVDAFGYGNRDVSGTPGGGDGLASAWLGTSLAISPQEQVAFLRAMLDGRLPVSAAAVEKTKAVVPAFKGDADWHIVGKTGSGWFRRADGSFDRSRAVGWFVGWGRREGRRVVFARLEIGPTPEKGRLGLLVRDAVIAALPRLVPPA